MSENTSANGQGKRQTIYRLKPYSQWTTVPNHILDHGLLPEDIGVLFYMLSRPDDWDFESRRIATALNVGKDKIRASLRRLEAAGFVHRRMVQGRGKRTFVTDHAHHEPCDCEQTLPGSPIKAQVGANAGFSIVGISGDKVSTEEPRTERDSLSSSSAAPDGAEEQEAQEEVPAQGDSPDWVDFLVCDVTHPEGCDCSPAPPGMPPPQDDSPPPKQLTTKRRTTPFSPEHKTTRTPCCKRPSCDDARSCETCADLFCCNHPRGKNVRAKITREGKDFNRAWESGFKDCYECHDLDGAIQTALGGMPDSKLKLEELQAELRERERLGRERRMRRKNLTELVWRAKRELDKDLGYRARVEETLEQVRARGGDPMLEAAIREVLDYADERYQIEQRNREYLRRVDSLSDDAGG